MALNRGIPLVALLLSVAACSSAGGGKPTSSLPSAHAGFGGPSAAPVVVTDVGEVFFRTPSKNIFCDLSASAVRCDIVRKTWSPPTKPSTCELDWGNGMYIQGGKAGFTCTGDTLIGSASQTLEYGHADRSGSVRCTSESAGLTCVDEKTGRGFLLAVARFSLF
ncbi:DUF6636 domain-containing protein [Actinoplanes subtropicus]|uniref:DUF6636 domain-containing protein n=1 Tax=Actinoplanes subtropicus TaxID=543632 RepID=UPI0012FBB50B|nr:DUF6636 domain-containing protein [Actinoplanes subtropicus]